MWVKCNCKKYFLKGGENMGNRNVRSAVNRATGVSMVSTRAIRGKNMRNASRRVSRGGAGG